MQARVFIDRHDNVWMPTNKGVTLLVGILLPTAIGRAVLDYTPRKEPAA